LTGLRRKEKTKGRAKGRELLVWRAVNSTSKMDGSRKRKKAAEDAIEQEKEGEAETSKANVFRVQVECFGLFRFITVVDPDITVEALKRVLEKEILELYGWDLEVMIPSILYYTREFLLYFYILVFILISLFYLFTFYCLHLMDFKSLFQLGPLVERSPPK